MKKFIRDERGNVVILFAFMLPVLLVSIGAAIDMARWLSAKDQTQSAVDAGLLAGARALQTDPDNESAAKAAAMKIYLANVESRAKVINDSVGFAITKDDGARAINATGNAEIETTLLHMVRVPTLPLNPAGRSEVRKGGKTGSNLEVAVMLDVTGSMCSPCSKLTAMKDAAKDLINVVIDKDQSGVTSKAAIIPFSESVNLGSRFSMIMSGAPSAPAAKEIQQANGQTRTWKRTSNCVVERTGDKKYSDAAPSSSNGFPMRPYTYDGKCSPDSSRSAFLPLSSDKGAIIEAIDDLETSGSTAGHIGTAWAWYALSPNWASRFPSNSRPQAYDPTKKTVRKVAVLMTDGEYNIQYCTSGAADKDSNRSNDQKGKCSAANGSSATQARKLCEGMKAEGIDVFTVGFKLDNYTARETLEQCATDKTMTYDAKDDTELRQAFRDIALKISDIYLSQ